MERAILLSTGQRVQMMRREIARGTLDNWRSPTRAVLSGAHGCAPRRTRSAISIRKRGRGSADGDAGAVVRLRRAVVADGLPDFLARARFGACALGVGDRAGSFAGQILADQVLDEDRQELALVERGVRLAHRVVD